MGEFFLLAFFAAVNPTLLAAVTVMLVLPSPKRLLLGYLLGAYLTSITIGLVIVFSLHDSGAVSTTKNTLSPLEDLAFGAIFLLIAYALGSARGERLSERRRERKEAKQAGKEKKDPLPQRLLGRGSARITFVVGAALTLPGVSYLTALHRLDVENLSASATVLSLIAFNVIMLVLLEAPLVGYALAPERTKAAVESFKGWLTRSGRTTAAHAMAILGGLLVLRGVLELIL
jgi:Sap-like sulfolipid-1-addressing protein